MPLVAEIGRQVASALDYAHEEKIIHRDIKPSNVMVEDQAGGRIHVRVLDFGLAAEIHSSKSRLSSGRGGTSGTRSYMAPEQWAGRLQREAVFLRHGGKCHQGRGVGGLGVQGFDEASPDWHGRIGGFRLEELRTPGLSFFQSYDKGQNDVSAIYDAGEVPFASVRRFDPEKLDRSGRALCLPGHVYVLVTHGGRYVKFVVRRIVILLPDGTARPAPPPSAGASAFWTEGLCTEGGCD